MPAVPCESPVRGREGYYPRIESLRGIAALMVVSAHAWQSPWRAPSGELRSFYQSSDVDSLFVASLIPLLRVFDNGGGAVNVFFVISGFVLALSLTRGPQEVRSAIWRFVSSRAFRIYPAIFASVLLIAGIKAIAPSPLVGLELLTLRNVVMNMLLLDVSLNGVMWSLQVEMIAIVPIFVAFFLHSRLGMAPVLVLFGVLVALSFAGRRMHWGGVDLTHLFAFIAGMLSYYIWRPEWSILKSAWCFSCLLLALLFVRLMLGFSSNWAVVIEAILAALVVGFLAYGRLGRLAGIFDNFVIRLYGKLSYSLYLLHPLTLVVMWNSTPMIAVGLAVLSVIATTPLAWLSYHYVERPGMSLGRRIIGEQPQRAAT